MGVKLKGNAAIMEVYEQLQKERRSKKDFHFNVFKNFLQLSCGRQRRRERKS